MMEAVSLLTLNATPVEHLPVSDRDVCLDYQRAKSFYEQVRRPCCPQEFPDFVPRSPYINAILGIHTVPDPDLPFWWTEGIVNSAQAKQNPWLRELLQEITWAEVMEGRISDKKLKEKRQHWGADERKLVSSPKIGNMLNVLFIEEPSMVHRFRKRNIQSQILPLWWYHLIFLSLSFAGFPTARFLLQTSLAEFNEGRFHLDRLEQFCQTTKKRPPKNESIETFLRQIFSEFPQVITRFNQRGSKTQYVMRVTADPYSIVTMSSRSPHWSSCQNPVQNDTHEMSHRLWANLLDPNMALMEMIDPAIDEEHNLVARAIIRIANDQKRDLLYLDCLYGERGYISSFVTLSRKLAAMAQLTPVAGRMVPFYTSFSSGVCSDPIDFLGYEPPYLDLGQWRKKGKLNQFSGEGHYIVSKEQHTN